VGQHNKIGGFTFGAAVVSVGAIWNFGKGTGLLLPSEGPWDTMGLFYGLGASDPEGLETKYYSFIQDLTYVAPNQQRIINFSIEK
jgi:hypothetical protein